VVAELSRALVDPASRIMVDAVRRFDGNLVQSKGIWCNRKGDPRRAGATPRLYLLNLYFKGEKFAGIRILLYWLTIMAWAFGRNA
jgi:hypothetical protein